MIVPVAVPKFAIPSRAADIPLVIVPAVCPCHDIDSHVFDGPRRTIGISSSSRCFSIIAAFRSPGGSIEMNGTERESERTEGISRSKG